MLPWKGKGQDVQLNLWHAHTAQNKTHSPDRGEEALNAIGDCLWWKVDVLAAFTVLVSQAVYTDRILF